MLPTYNTLHIIHLPHRTDRLKLLSKELEKQNITDFTVCPGIYDELPFKGIAAAHKLIISLAKQQGWPKCRIAEDDINFTGPGAWDYYLSREPSIADLYLGSVTYGVFDTTNKYVVDFAGLTLYTIYSDFYDSFLDISTDEHIDRGLRYKGKYMVCNPMVALQHPGYSDNHQKIVNYKSCFKNARLFGR